MATRLNEATVRALVEAEVQATNQYAVEFCGSLRDELNVETTVQALAADWLAMLAVLEDVWDMRPTSPGHDCLFCAEWDGEAHGEDCVLARVAVLKEGR